MLQQLLYWATGMAAFAAFVWAVGSFSMWFQGLEPWTPPKWLELVGVALLVPLLLAFLFSLVVLLPWALGVTIWTGR